MNKISCFLLAAGQSSRMGTVNKLLLPIAGKSLIRRTVEELLKFSFAEIVVITGHESELIISELKGLAVQFVLNSNFASGMHSSIRAGLNNSRVAANDGFMICLSDQPFFQIDLVKKLSEIFSENSGPRIVFPVVGQKRGHPVLISTHFIPEILNEPDADHGCHYLFQRHPDQLIQFETEGESIFIDVDTPEQYAEHRGFL